MPFEAALLSAAFLDTAWSAIVEFSQAAVESATGWGGLGVIFTYSFLIAFVLPGPSEVVLAAPIDIGLPRWLTLAGIMGVSAFGKTAGSLVAFHVGQEAKSSGPVVRWLENTRFDVIEWSENRTVELAQEWGYVGMALALCVPFFPDTVSIYAFAVLENDYAKFGAATFVGSIGRLLVTLLLIGGVITVF